LAQALSKLFQIAWGDSESRQMLEHAIETGRGGVYLRLTPDQYKKLRRL
jgi:hypothetical protein